MAAHAFIRPYTSRPASGPLILNPLGDSITDGLAPSGGYRGILLPMIADRLGGAVGPAGVVDSLGGKSSTTYDMDPAICGTAASGFGGTSAAYWIANGTMATYNPGTVHMGLLMLGANDAGDDAETATLYTGPLMDQFLDLHPMAILFCASRTPRNYSSGAVYSAAVQNEVEIRRARGMNVVFVDQYRAVDLADSYDGLHYTEAGNRKMADRWFAAMAPYLR